MDIKLTIYSEDKQYFSRIVSLPCVIGRGQQCDVAIVHPLISRRHCEIYEEDGAVMTRDLGSLNGTYYNKNRIGRGVSIPFGDSFNIGKLFFKIERIGDATTKMHELLPTDEDDAKPAPAKAAEKAPEKSAPVAPPQAPPHAPAEDSIDLAVVDEEEVAQNEPADDPLDADVLDLDAYLGDE